MKKLLPLFPLLFVTFGFEFFCRSGVLPPYLFPAPSQVFAALIESRTEFFQAFLQTATASSAGLMLTILFGITVSVLLSLSEWARLLFYPYAVFFQTVPIIAIAPLLVIWLGYGLPTVIASAFIVSVFPVIANTVSGLLSTESAYLQLFQMFGANKLQTLIQLRIPFALPQILTGIKISSGLAVIGAIVGEFISGNGLGGVVDAARNQQRIDRVFAAVLLASLLGIIFFSLVSFLSNVLLKQWHPSERDK